MTDTVALITGAGGGMGRCCAARLRAEHQLVLVDVVEPPAEPGDLVITVDVTDPASVDPIVEAISAAGPLGPIVHTAGLSPTMDVGRRIFDVNLVATARLLDALEPLLSDRTAAVLLASQAGHISATDDRPDLDAAIDDPLAPSFWGDLESHGSDVLADPGMAYGWSKRGVQRQVVARAPSWGARGARIVSISPGIIDTAMGRQEADQQPAIAWLIEQTPLGRMGEADEVASVIAFLVSDAASYVTGVDLLVDGGSTNQVAASIAELGEL